MFKLLNAYFTCNTSVIDDRQEILFNNKLKSCLCQFFESFTIASIQNRDAMSKMAIPMFKYCLDNSKQNIGLKKIVNFFYYFTSETKNKRQFVVIAILNQIMENLSDFNLLQKWIEVLIEFNIHQSDVECDSNVSIILLKEIHSQIGKIFVINSN